MPRTPIDYSNTIMYRLVCKDTNITECYIGHTTDFTKRKYQHKFATLNPKSGKYNIKVYSFIRDNGNWQNWDMIEIEKVNCLDSNEARKRERYWSEEYKSTLNSFRPIRYETELKDYLRDFSKQYRELNIEKIKEYQKQWYKNKKIINKN